MSYQIKQSTTAYPLVFLMIDSTDHVSAKTGLSPTVTLSKSGAAFASPSGAVTEIANGWYKVAGNATDSNTLGPLILHATGTGADPTDIIYEVVAFDPQDSVRGGLTALPNAAAEAAGGLYTRGTGAGQIAQDANGNVRVNVDTIKTQTVTLSGGVTIPAATLASTTNITAATGITVSTNNDKTGYGLSAAAVQAIWDALTSALTTAGSIGKKLADWVIGTTQTADVAAVKTQTDKLTFTVANQVDANIQYVNDIAVTGAGTGANPWGP